jgi:hypothetical protein
LSPPREEKEREEKRREEIPDSMTDVPHKCTHT